MDCCVLSTNYASDTSSCSARSLEETHLLTMTSCLERASSLFLSNALINDSSKWFTLTAEIHDTYTDNMLPELLVCSSRQVSPAQPLIDQMDRWCNTTSAPTRQTQQKINTWSLHMRRWPRFFATFETFAVILWSAERERHVNGRSAEPLKSSSTRSMTTE